jgi:uncharacterized membrane protein (UPF0127 family)
MRSESPGSLAGMHDVMRGSAPRGFPQALSQGAPFFMLFFAAFSPAFGGTPSPEVREERQKLQEHWVLKAEERAAFLRGKGIASVPVLPALQVVVPLPRRRIVHLFVPRAYFPEGARVIAGRGRQVLFERARVPADEPGLTIEKPVDWIAVSSVAQPGWKYERLRAKPEPDPLLRLGREEWDLEVLQRPEDHERGMMFRTAIDPNHGMLFDFGTEQPLRFWMRNCRVPIDVAFVAGDGRILNVSTMTPPSRGDEQERELPTWPSSGPARFALEGKGGSLRRRGLKPGVILKLPVGVSNVPAR